MPRLVLRAAPPLTILALASLTAAVGIAQDSTRPDPHGELLWIARFDQRPFELEDLRLAIRRGDRAAGERIVTELEDGARRHQAPFALAAERIGAQVVHRWWLVNGCSLRATDAQARQLARHPMVADLRREIRVQTTIKSATNAKNHNADHVHSVLKQTGKGVVVGIVDSGLDIQSAKLGRPHRTFFVGGDPKDKSGGGIGGSRVLFVHKLGTLGPDDPGNHGTGVASIAAGANWRTFRADDGHAPGAQIAGYSIAVGSPTSSTNAVMVQAWQQMVKDRVRHRIVAANLSFSGTPDPLDPSQVALDTAARVGDILITVAAGNTGAHTRMSQSAFNGLAVGAVTNDAHVVPTWSSRGPLEGSADRFYPDLVATGVQTVMADSDNEAGEWVADGTSMAAPQVCGAAALVRAANPKLSALETKAILLATTADVTRANPKEGRNAFGLGLLRDDLAVELARDARGVQTQKVDSKSREWTHTLRIQQGRAYSICLAWHRDPSAGHDRTDLSLRVESGGRLLAVSNSPSNAYERVTFRSDLAPSKLVTIRVRAERFQSGTSSQEFALARYALPVALGLPPQFENFGFGCPGSGISQPTICQAVVNRSTIHSLPAMGGEIAFEMTAQRDLVVRGFRITVHGNIRGTFRRPNASGRPGPVLATSIMRAVGTGRDARMEAVFTPLNLTIPQGAKFFLGIQGTPMLRVAGASGTAIPFYRRSSSSSPWRARAISLPYRSGTIPSAPTLELICSQPAATPLLESRSHAWLGATVVLDIRQGAPSSIAGLFTGLSATRMGPLRLPLDLAPHGAPSCALQTSTEFFSAHATDRFGNANASFGVPNDKSIVGQTVFHQAFVFDAKANRLGLSTSSARLLTFGGPLR